MAATPATAARTACATLHLCEPPLDSSSSALLKLRGMAAHNSGSQYVYRTLCHDNRGVSPRQNTKPGGCATRTRSYFVRARQFKLWKECHRNITLLLATRQTTLMLCPLNALQVDSLLHHFPQRAHLAQTGNVLLMRQGTGA